MPDGSQTRSSWKHPVVLGAGLIVLAGVAILSARLAGWFPGTDAERSGGNEAHRSQDTDPRRGYTGPYQNIDPDVRYVGQAECAKCHHDIAVSYARHPMGRSLVAAAALVDRQRYGPETNNPFTVLGRTFHVERLGKHLWQRQSALAPAKKGEAAVELSQEVKWVLGSGTRGHAYLMDRDGFLLQTAIGWFAQKQRWDLSPGFGPEVLTGRPVQASCLFCHTDQVREDPDVVDRFVISQAVPIRKGFDGHAIGCERCHGPGQKHVQSRRLGDVGAGVDYTIVNPARLAPLLREAVCEQCHLEGEARVLRSGRGLFDYRPGLPLSDFWAVIVPAAESNPEARAVNHVEQMYQSACFRLSASSHQMGCTSCHDPHVHVDADKRVVHYRAACLKCHEEGRVGSQRACSVPLSERRRTHPRDSCIDCHMPRYASSDIAHTASTDHRIPRRAKSIPNHAADLDRTRFVDFYSGRFTGGDQQRERNLGMGLVKMMVSGLLRPDKHGDEALFLLESALGRFPQDAEVRAHKTLALLLLPRPAEALPEAQTVLASRPGHWRLLAQAAAAAQASAQLDLAGSYWRRAAELNPFVPDYQVNLIALLIRTGMFDEARTRVQQLLRLDPFNVSGRQALVGFLLQDGKKAEARVEFEIIRRLNPPDLAKREEWFKQQVK
jgi:hypothetical protein